LQQFKVSTSFSVVNFSVLSISESYDGATMTSSAMTLGEKFEAYVFGCIFHFVRVFSRPWIQLSHDLVVTVHFI
jgi:hypothetical protein